MPCFGGFFLQTYGVKKMSLVDNLEQSKKALAEAALAAVEKMAREDRTEPTSEERDLFNGMHWTAQQVAGKIEDARTVADLQAKASNRASLAAMVEAAEDAAKKRLPELQSKVDELQREILAISSRPGELRVRLAAANDAADRLVDLCPPHISEEADQLEQKIETTVGDRLRKCQGHENRLLSFLDESRHKSHRDFVQFVKTHYPQHTTKVDGKLQLSASWDGQMSSFRAELAAVQGELKTLRSEFATAMAEVTKLREYYLTS
jgi:hypothetical protein